MSVQWGWLSERTTGLGPYMSPTWFYPWMSACLLVLKSLMLESRTEWYTQAHFLSFLWFDWFDFDTLQILGVDTSHMKWSHGIISTSSLALLVGTRWNKARIHGRLAQGNAVLSCATLGTKAQLFIDVTKAERQGYFVLIGTSGALLLSSMLLLARAVKQTEGRNNFHTLQVPRNFCYVYYWVLKGVCSWSVINRDGWACVENKRTITNLQRM